MAHGLSGCVLFYVIFNKVWLKMYYYNVVETQLVPPPYDLGTIYELCMAVVVELQVHNENNSYRSRV